MGLRDDVRHRRHEKIKSLLEEYANQQEAAVPKQQAQTQTKEDSHMVFPSAQTAAAPHDYLPKQIQDPELAWKRNPNPWSSWNESGDASGGTRSFVRQTRTYDDSERPEQGWWGRFLRSLRWKAIAALLAFGAIYGMFQYEADWSLRGQQFVKQALTDEFDFAAASVWYKQAFAGAPSFIPMFRDTSEGALGVNGEVASGTVVVPIQDASLIRTFAELLNGIELAGASEAPVSAAETGRVIVVTEDKESVIIQHANHRVTVYAKLGDASVSVNDWVEAGETIGKLKKANESGQSLLHFAVKQNDRYVDPLEVITLD